MTPLQSMHARYEYLSKNLNPPHIPISPNNLPNVQASTPIKASSFNSVCFFVFRFVSVLFMLFCICFVYVVLYLFCICFVYVVLYLFCLCFVYVVLFLFCFSERSERRLELIFEDFSGDKIIKRFTCFVEKLKEHFDTFEVKMKDASGKHLQTRLAGRSNIVTMMAFWQDVTNNWLLVTWNWWTIGLN